MAELNRNGEPLDMDVDGSTPTRRVLREQLSLSGTNCGCGIGICGSCTVHVDGKAVGDRNLPVSGLDERHDSQFASEAAGKALSQTPAFAVRGAMSC